MKTHWRFVLLVTLILTGQAVAQESMLVLVDGRVVPYVGEYTTEGERLIFTSPSGERLFLAKDQVDLPQTLRFREFVNEREARIAKARAEIDSATPPPQTSLADQVTAYNNLHPQEPQGTKKLLVYTNDEAKGRSGKDQSDSDRLKELELPPFEEMGARAISERALRTAETVGKTLKAEHDYLLYAGYVWVVLGILLSFLAMACQLYLVVRSYSHGLRWGLSITLVFMVMVGEYFVPVHPALRLVNLLGYHALLIAYIFSCCYGRRALFLGLIYSIIPYVLVTVGLATLLT